MSFNHKHYVPILKAKQGEFAGLKEIPIPRRSRFTPLLEMLPESAGLAAATTVDKKSRVKDLPTKVSESWGVAHPVFVDFQLISEKGGSEKAAAECCANLAKGRELGVQFVPVLRLQEAQPYLASVKEAIGQDRRGCCLRLNQSDFIDLTSTSADMDSLLGTLGIKYGDVDVVVDWGSIPETHAVITAGTRLILGNLPNLMEWRSLTLATGAFPETLSSVGPNSVARLPRTDWLVWLNVLFAQIRPRRLPAFGDYGIGHPALAELDMRIIKPSANMRYASSDIWVIVKGTNIRDNGCDQMHERCEVLRLLPEFEGQSGYWADEQIVGIADRSRTHGNATTWRSIGTNRHIEFVLNQIANYPGL